MPLILHIDTATENATVSLARDGAVIYLLTNDIQKDHAAFLQPAIKRLLNETGISADELNAIAVTAGPGSYTGLRVGMSSAKGICYALQIPLIAINSLEVMALSVINNTADQEEYLYCPMIDAGRMEVFTALFDNELNNILPPCALILEPGSFAEVSPKARVIFFGTGSQKFKGMSNSNFMYGVIPGMADALSFLSLKKFQQHSFANLLNAEPVYLKPFYTLSNPDKT